MAVSPHAGSTFTKPIFKLSFTFTLDPSDSSSLDKYRAMVYMFLRALITLVPASILSSIVKGIEEPDGSVSPERLASLVQNTVRSLAASKSPSSVSALKDIDISVPADTTCQTKAAAPPRTGSKNTSNARSSLEQPNSHIPLPAYYTPVLPPAYPNQHDEYYHLPAKALVKWHRMVFPGPIHPTLGPQSHSMIARNMMYSSAFTNRDRREMHRISRLVSDEKVFRKKGGWKWTPKYKRMWERWLELERGSEPEVVVAFEDS